jgi:ClpP class serine protease
LLYVIVCGSAALQQMIEQGYRDFLDRVAESRGMTTEEVDDRDGLSGPAAL